MAIKCPKCAVDLRIGERQGIEIDVCPQCRGMWLDRGEFDRIAERTSRDSESDGQDRRGREHRDDDGHHRYYHRRNSFWTGG